MLIVAKITVIGKFIWKQVEIHNLFTQIPVEKAEVEEIGWMFIN